MIAIRIVVFSDIFSIVGFVRDNPSNANIRNAIIIIFIVEYFSLFFSSSELHLRYNVFTSAKERNVFFFFYFLFLFSYIFYRAYIYCPSHRLSGALWSKLRAFACGSGALEARRRYVFEFHACGGSSLRGPIWSECNVRPSQVVLHSDVSPRNSINIPVVSSPSSKMPPRIQHS